MTELGLSKPPMTLSTAFSKSTKPTDSLSCRAAIRAASLQMLEMSAPAKPGVRAARRLARWSRSKSLAREMGLRCTLKICVLPLMSGLSTWI